jgi:hypothetical protein
MRDSKFLFHLLTAPRHRRDRERGFSMVVGMLSSAVMRQDDETIAKRAQLELVQGYVQWIVQDFATAYRKLDFSDLEEPMRLVNLQLKEQE